MAKSAMFHVRVSEAERAALDALAAAEGVKPGALLRRAVRRLIAAPDMVQEDREALWAAIRVVRGLGQELGRIAKASRDGELALDAEAQESLAELKRAVRALQKSWVAYQAAERDRAAKMLSIELGEAS